MKITLAACAAYPELSVSNALLAESLKGQGAEVEIALWNRDPMDAFLGADLVLLRQTWDYQDDPGGFAAWAARLTHLGGRLEAPAHLAIWNNDKRSLRDLAALGLSIPQTLSLTPPWDSAQIDALPGERVVLKPAFGGSGVGVRLCARGQLAQGAAQVLAEAPGRPLMAQEFLPEIAEGEWKMTCIDGRVALTVRAVPGGDAFRINSRFEPDITLAAPPEPARMAAETLLAQFGVPLAARVDGVMRGATFLCTELELTDPDLHLHFAPGIADTLAKAAIQRAAIR